MDESDFSLSISFIVIMAMLIIAVLGIGVHHMAKSDQRLRRMRRAYRAPPQ